MVSVADDDQDTQGPEEQRHESHSQHCRLKLSLLSLFLRTQPGIWDCNRCIATLATQHLAAGVLEA